MTNQGASRASSSVPRRGPLLLASLLALLCAPGVRAADAPSRFKVQKLSLDGDVLDVIAADLDGDGKKDLVIPFVSGVAPAQKRSLAIFWNGSQGLAAKPDLIVSADEDRACSFDLASIDGLPGDELIFATDHGVVARSLRGRTLGPKVMLSEGPTLFVEPDKGELPRMALVQPLGAGVQALLVPRLDGLLVLVNRAGVFTRAALLPVQLEASYSRRRRITLGRGPGGYLSPVNARFVFPAVHLADFDGDGLIDLFLAQEDRIAVFKQAAGGAFKEQPDYARDFAIRTPEERKESSSPAAVMIRDIDGDGRADLVVRKQVSQGLASATTTSLVFFGEPGGGYGKTADQVLRHEGASGVEVQLADVTADGRPDLVVPSVNIGVFAIIRIITSKTLKMNFQVFAFDPKARRFDGRPSAERELRFKISTDGQADSQAVDLFGDYDGDGRPDLVYGTDDEELSIFRGQPGGALFEEDPVEKIDVRAFGDVLPVDLTGAGRDDLVLHYPATKGRRGEVVVLLNQGGWPAKK
jgi:hypothetical protein